MVVQVKRCRRERVIQLFFGKMNGLRLIREIADGEEIFFGLMRGMKIHLRRSPVEKARRQWFHFVVQTVGHETIVVECA